jgi:hypothetical protein
MSPPYQDNGLYVVRSASGSINVARYLTDHDLFFATGDSIGYFPRDLIVGALLDLSQAFPAEEAAA